MLRSLHVIAPAQFHDKERLTVRGEMKEIHIREGMIGTEASGMDDGGKLSSAGRLVVPLPIWAGKTMG